MSATDASGRARRPTDGDVVQPTTSKLATGESVETGLDKLRGWWGLQGAWPADDDATGAIIGTSYASARGLNVGDTFTLTREGVSQDFTVRGIITSGDDADRGVFIQLPAAQTFIGREGAVGSVEVSALRPPTMTWPARPRRTRTR